MCLGKSILHLKNWPLPGHAIDSLNEAKIFCLLSFLQILTFDSRFSFAIEKHCDCISLVDARAFRGSKETEGIELSLQQGKPWSKEGYVISVKGCLDC